jgi:type II pantothenate kinase
MNIVGASVSEAFYAAHETRDIVLPNQTNHVSQIAVDVRSHSLYIIEK